MIRKRSWILHVAGSAFLLIILAGVLGGIALWHVSAGHIPEYLTWRYMVTFNVPISPVDYYSIRVEKSGHRLLLNHGSQIVRSYRIAISQYGTELRRTYVDKLTPEGTFRIASMQYHSAFGPRQMLLETTALALADYRAQYGAAADTALSAWEAGHGPLDTIWETYDFNKANPSMPIWNDILIHGGGSDRDWTWGCIALDDGDIIELFDLLKGSSAGGLGIGVIIQP